MQLPSPAEWLDEAISAAASRVADNDMRLTDVTTFETAISRLGAGFSLMTAFLKKKAPNRASHAFGDPSDDWEHVLTRFEALLGLFIVAADFKTCQSHLSLYRFDIGCQYQNTVA